MAYTENTMASTIFTITQLCDKVREVDPNNAEAVKGVVNTFFQTVTNIEDSDSITWLRTLGDVVNRFPKYCMSHRDTIESILKSSLDSNDYYCVIEAAKCAQAVQQVRPCQNKTATPKTLWQEQMSLLCNAAQSLISAIFPNVINIHEREKNRKNQELSPNSPLTSTLLNITSTDNEKKDKSALLQIRLRNVFCYIQAMLVEVYPVAKPIQLLMILDLIRTAVHVSSVSKNPDVDVPTVKIETLRTLDALVACLGANLIPFSSLIFMFLMSALRWSSGIADLDSSQVRCTAYSSLVNWFNVLHCHCLPAQSKSSWEDELIKHILADNTKPMEKVVQLTMGPQPTKHMSKRAKRKLANSRLQESSISSHMPGERNKISMLQDINNEVAMAALNCAETFLLVCGRFLKPTSHKLLQQWVLRECYIADRYNEDMLISLLHVAEALRKTTPSVVPPPTNHCLQLYSVLGNTAQGEIAKFCTNALLDIRLHLHCSPPPLFSIREESHETQAETTIDKNVSKKNWAALNSFLGPDRMAALDSQEVITIPDEPSSKKQRPNEEPDRISLSSESFNSVEVSDDSDIEEVPIDIRKGKVNRQEEKDEEGGEEEASINANSVIVKNSNIEKGPDVAVTLDSIDLQHVTSTTMVEEQSENPVTVTDLVETVAADINVEYELVDEKDKSNDVTMGQKKASTQMPHLEKKPDNTDLLEGEVNEAAKINGKNCENDVVGNDVDIQSEKTKDHDISDTKAVSKDGTVSIEDMMADFVDEVEAVNTVT